MRLAGQAEGRAALGRLSLDGGQAWRYEGVRLSPDCK